MPVHNTYRIPFFPVEGWGGGGYGKGKYSSRKIRIFRYLVKLIHPVASTDWSIYCFPFDVLALRGKVIMWNMSVYGCNGSAQYF